MAGVSGWGFCGSVQPSEKEENSVSQWWNGKYFTGDWLGVRDDLAERGIEFKGKWVGVYNGVVSSERGARGFFDQELTFDAGVNAAKLTGCEALNGWNAYTGVRWRDPRASSNPNSFIEGNPTFNPGRYQSGTQWRFTHFYLEYVSPEVFGIESFLTLKGGWVQPQKDFMCQPLALLFVNTSLSVAKGLTYNMPWSTSFSTWGGMMQVKPTREAYIRGGLYMAYPQATASSNHGLAFAGFAPNPSRNDLMTLLEAGWTPSFGEAKLPGKYAIGGYYFGVDAVSFVNGKTVDGTYGFYLQADQMLFREKGAEKSGCSDKSFKAPADTRHLSDQGLSMFSLVTFAPADVSLMDFYFQNGFVYKGLIPGRDKDQTMCAVACGTYSKYRIHQIQCLGNENQPNVTLLIEADHRIEINSWSYVQPFVQYLIRPNGTDAVANATVLGFMAGVTF